ncbi:MAG: hypothetical protein IKG65_11820 [Exiguobacterium sp.]|uniref:hypothetical protein n=1 Tax=Exiguobacterium TaxID=33986 RepID=UPI001BA5C558|nr:MULTISPECIES: hypothetical protein [Exiguobacterium]MBR2077765.1 hypothetical protein [Exiguobacterium sp.]MBR2757457.1 hypothetical protein [Exiguobacterium sp.]MBR3063071.1 hypothetical protein [Exiguobacterium sp.]MBR3215966.1 hypothetical protein [Exiguobacterium sp.]MDX5980278.1 hypothetical protein [Exiguobacterium profundum]
MTEHKDQLTLQRENQQLKEVNATLEAEKDLIFYHYDELLKRYETLSSLSQHMAKELSEIAPRYEALNKSKLTKVTRKYWELRRKLRRRR